MPHPLSDFLAAHDWDTLARINGWKLTLWKDDPDLICFELRAKDGQWYRVLLDCTGYPDQAPGVVFVDDQGNKNELRAWPAGTPQFYDVVKHPPHCFLCMPLTREGLAHHAEWRNDPTKNPWNGRKHTLLDVLNYLQRLLRSRDYIERSHL